MGLTLMEKNHWKERISRKIDQAIDALVANKDPMFKINVEQEARKRAIRSLGITDQMERCDVIKKTLKSLQAEYANLIEGVERTLIPSAQFTRNYYDSTSRVENAIKERQAICEVDIMNETALGHKIQELTLEQEELLDTVWLATSPAQIAKLWGHVIKLLGEPLTDLQRETLQALETTPEAAE